MKHARRCLRALSSVRGHLRSSVQLRRFESEVTERAAQLVAAERDHGHHMRALREELALEKQQQRTRKQRSPAYAHLLLSLL